MNIVAEIVDAFLAIYKLTQAAHKAIAFVVTVVSLIGKLNFISSLNAFGNDVRCESLCEWKGEFLLCFLLQSNCKGRKISIHDVTQEKNIACNL